MTHPEYRRSVAELNEASENYYRDGSSEMSDVEFDSRIKKLENYERFNPDKIHENSPTKTIGKAFNSEKDIVSSVPDAVDSIGILNIRPIIYNNPPLKILDSIRGGVL